MLESDLQAALLIAAPYHLPHLRLFRRNVGKFKLANHDGSTRVLRVGIPGQCDLYGLLRGGRHVELELKSRSGRLEDDQKSWRDACQAWGIPWLLLKAERGETKEQTVDRWISEIRKVLGQ
jgi:hypothetical protein